MLLAVLLLSSVSGSMVTQVSDPGDVNRIFKDISSDTIRPGEHGTLTYVLHNPYPQSMTDVRLRVEIYSYSTLDVNKPIQEVSSPPRFVSSRNTYNSFIHPLLEPGQEITIRHRMETSRSTPKGVYFLRFEILFDYEGSEQLMRSKGFFTRDEWYHAERLPGEADRPYYSGSLNITYLGVNGIVPDTSFTVKTPIPRWPQYALGGLSAFFGVLAVMLYMQEEYDSFPWLEKTLDKWSAKFKEFRRGLDNRSRKV